MNVHLKKSMTQFPTIFILWTIENQKFPLGKTRTTYIWIIRRVGSKQISKEYIDNKCIPYPRYQGSRWSICSTALNYIFGATDVPLFPDRPLARGLLCHCCSYSPSSSTIWFNSHFLANAKVESIYERQYRLMVYIRISPYRCRVSCNTLKIKIKI